MKLKKIKLNKLSDDTLAQRQMKGLKGGSPCCSCGCYYEYTGGASIMIMVVLTPSIATHQ